MTPRESSKIRASTTSDILGRPSGKAPKPRIDSKWSQHYQHLTDLKSQLLAQAGKLAREASEATPTYSMHMADAGTDSFDRDFALSLLSSDQDSLYEIEEALKRIEAGTYGKCELTGKPIPANRLAAIPWARFSANAQRELEREGALKHKQLSSLSSLPTSDAAEPNEDEAGGESADKD